MIFPLICLNYTVATYHFFSLILQTLAVQLGRFNILKEYVGSSKVTGGVIWPSKVCMKNWSVCTRLLRVEMASDVARNFCWWGHLTSHYVLVVLSLRALHYSTPCMLKKLK